jgi:hypothetical protein
MCAVKESSGDDADADARALPGHPKRKPSKMGSIDGRVKGSSSDSRAMKSSHSDRKRIPAGLWPAETLSLSGRQDLNLRPLVTERHHTDLVIDCQE